MFPKFPLRLCHAKTHVETRIAAVRVYMRQRKLIVRSHNLLAVDMDSTTATLKSCRNVAAFVRVYASPYSLWMLCRLYSHYFRFLFPIDVEAVRLFGKVV